jgi:hypothetical protein
VSPLSPSGAAHSPQVHPTCSQVGTLRATNGRVGIRANEVNQPSPSPLGFQAGVLKQRAGSGIGPAGQRALGLQILGNDLACKQGIGLTASRRMKPVH